MKKGIALFLVLIMCLSLTACGKSKAAQAADDAILLIGEVSLNSESAILEAEKLYNILTDDEKAQVENRLVLVNAREKYDELLAAQIAAEEEAARAAAEAEYVALINAALPEATKIVNYYSFMLNKMDFVYKYAGNTNGKGDRGFADSFIEPMYEVYSTVDMDLVEEAFPELAQDAKAIRKNFVKIADLLVEMGVTNSASNVPTMRSLCTETTDMIGESTDKQMEFVESLGIDIE